MGETETEHATNQRAWKEVVQKAALTRIDVLVGEEERLQPPRNRKGRSEVRSPSEALADQQRDEHHMKEAIEALTGPPGQQVTLQCNLLVIEPDRNDGQPHAWAIRYINSKTFSRHDTRKQERVNTLRLYSLLVQEKILRDPKSIHVCVAELTHRHVAGMWSDNYPEYFSPKTYWSSQQLWEFIGVPFGVVELAICDVAKEFRERLKTGLRGLLPENRSPRTLS